MTNYQYLNQGNGNIEEYIQLIRVISQQMKDLEALSVSIPEVIEEDLTSRFQSILDQLDTFIGTSVAAKDMMEIIFGKWRELEGNRL